MTRSFSSKIFLTGGEKLISARALLTTLGQLSFIHLALSDVISLSGVRSESYMFVKISSSPRLYVIIRTRSPMCNERHKEVKYGRLRGSEQKCPVSSQPGTPQILLEKLPHFLLLFLCSILDPFVRFFWSNRGVRWNRNKPFREFDDCNSWVDICRYKYEPSVKCCLLFSGEVGNAPR